MILTGDYVQALHKFHVKIFAVLWELLLPFHTELLVLLQSVLQAEVEGLMVVLQDAWLQNKKKIHHYYKPFRYTAFLNGLNPTFLIMTGTSRRKMNMPQVINDQTEIHCNMHQFSSCFCSHRTFWNLLHVLIYSTEYKCWNMHLSSGPSVQ